jgi:hypothetical protein
VAGALAAGAGYVGTELLADVGVGALTGGVDWAALGDSVPVLLASGLLLGATLAYAADWMTAGPRRQFVVWWTLVFLSTVGVVVEGWAFAPDLVPTDSLPWRIASAALVAGVVAAVLATVFGDETAREPALPSLPPTRRFLAGLTGGTATYSVLYFLVGALNYALVTGPYYEQQVGGLENPPLQVVAGVFLLRGVLLSVSLLPLVRTVAAPRPRAWLSVLSVGVLTGLLPLLRQVGTLPLVVLAASSYEIVLQVGPAAIVVAAIVGKGAVPSLRGELRRIWRGTRRESTPAT